MKEELKNMELDDTSLEKVTGGGSESDMTDPSQCQYYNNSGITCSYATFDCAYIGCEKAAVC